MICAVSDVWCNDSHCCLNWNFFTLINKLPTFYNASITWLLRNDLNLCLFFSARSAFQTSECERRSASNPLIDMSTSGLWMTSSSDVAALPVTSAIGVDSHLPSDTCNRRSRDHAPATKKKPAGRKGKQVRGKISALNHSNNCVIIIIIIYRICIAPTTEKRTCRCYSKN